jgi:gamma-glutamyltranspeptidase/glutathione hydrolase
MKKAGPTHLCPFAGVALALLLFSGLEGCGPEPRAPVQRGRYSLPQVASGSGVVVSDDELASAAGVEILNARGNAIDGAVATALALAVTYPEAGNIGGGGFLVGRFSDGRSVALDFREKAPMKGTRDMYLDSAGRVTDRSLIGHLASGVPGTVAGLWEAHRRYGALPWSRVCAPAIRLAREGFTVTQRFERTLRGDSALLVRSGGSRRLFFPDGRPLRAGTRWSNPELARTLDLISEQGSDGFYRGPTAELILAEMARGGGLISAEDLASYQALWRTPVTFRYRGHSVISMPPPSSGGVTLAIVFGILDRTDLSREAWHSATELHLTAEAMRRAFAVRNAFLGDPDMVHVPVDSLISPDAIGALDRSIDRDRATPSVSIVVGGTLSAREPDQTTHLSVADGMGNAVALTTTVNGLYGNGVTVAGAGFLLNNEMDDFAARPGMPNGFGLVQGEANAIGPGKRMLSSMTPTIVCDADGAPMIVTGGRGGPNIITAVAQVIANLVDHGMDLPEAVAAPRIHHQHLPDRLLCERGAADSAATRTLQGMGHTLVPSGGSGSVPTLLRRGDVWMGAPDPRTGGAALARQASHVDR